MSSFYDQYFKLLNRNITIHMKNNDSLHGAIVGVFYRNNVIYKWRVIIHNNTERNGLLNNQLFDEKVIFVKDVKSVVIDFNQLKFNF